MTILRAASTKIIFMAITIQYVKSSSVHFTGAAVSRSKEGHRIFLAFVRAPS
jgi:hypothetical protein